MSARRTRVRPPLYWNWMAMRRCCGLVRGLTAYQMSHYVGVAVCPEWQEYRAFEEWGMANGWAPGLHLTRRDKARDFCPGNCFWAPLAVANGFRRCVRRLPDGRSARDLLGMRNLGRDAAEQMRVAHRLFDKGSAAGWNAENAVAAPRCSSRFMAERVRAEIARAAASGEGCETASGECPEGRAGGKLDHPGRARPTF